MLHHHRSIDLAADAGVEVDGSLSGAGGSILLRCGMDRTTLEMDLRQAEAHVANGQKRIAQQHEIIAELDREGHFCFASTWQSARHLLAGRQLKRGVAPSG